MTWTWFITIKSNYEIDKCQQGKLIFMIAMTSHQNCDLWTAITTCHHSHELLPTIMTCWKTMTCHHTHDLSSKPWPVTFTMTCHHNHDLSISAVNPSLASSSDNIITYHTNFLIRFSCRLSESHLCGLFTESMRFDSPDNVLNNQSPPGLDCLQILVVGSSWHGSKLPVCLRQSTDQYSQLKTIHYIQPSSIVY